MYPESGFDTSTSVFSRVLRYFLMVHSEQFSSFAILRAQNAQFSGFAAMYAKSPFASKDRVGWKITEFGNIRYQPAGSIVLFIVPTNKI